MITVRVSIPRKMKRKDPVFVGIRNALVMSTKQPPTFGQAGYVPPKEQHARQQNNPDKTYERRQGYRFV